MSTNVYSKRRGKIPLPYVCKSKQRRLANIPWNWGWYDCNLELSASIPNGPTISNAAGAALLPLTIVIYDETVAGTRGKISLNYSIPTPYITFPLPISIITGSYSLDIWVPYTNPAFPGGHFTKTGQIAGEFITDQLDYGYAPTYAASLFFSLEFNPQPAP